MMCRELTAFLVVGSLTVMVDFCTYHGVLWLGWAGVDAAKGLGFLIGTVFAYVANRHWTFGHKQHAAGSVWRFALLYAATLGANVAINAGALAALRNWPGHVHLAFLLATGTSATLNFVGMKLFVFKAAPRPDLA